MHCCKLLFSPHYPWGQENAPQGEFMRRFDFPNNANTIKMIDSLWLGPSVHPFPLPSPLPPPTSCFSRTSLIPQITMCYNQSCAKSMWSCGRPISYVGGPPANREAIYTQRAADKSTGDATGINPFYPRVKKWLSGPFFTSTLHFGSYFLLITYYELLPTYFISCLLELPWYTCKAPLLQAIPKHLLGKHSC